MSDCGVDQITLSDITLPPHCGSGYKFVVTYDFKLNPIGNILAIIVKNFKNSDYEEIRSISLNVRECNK